MLNQNYTYVGKKKNCRIALGAYSNPMCNVHEDFRCIVLVDLNNVDFTDPPFLNRFEKQMILYLLYFLFFIFIYLFITKDLFLLKVQDKNQRIAQCNFLHNANFCANQFLCNAIFVQSTMQFLRNALFAQYNFCAMRFLHSNFWYN